jgi:hypothetical protein
MAGAGTLKHSPRGAAASAAAGRALADGLAEGGLLWLACRSALFLTVVVGWLAFV